MGKHRNLSPGDVVESLELLENLGYRKYCDKNTTYWKCKCLKCGNVVEVPLKILGKGQKDCGCWRSAVKKLLHPGEIFGNLEVVSIDKSENGRGYYYKCKCKCGTTTIVRGDQLRSGEIRSCGCLKNEAFEANRQNAYNKNFVNNTSIPKLNAAKLQKNNTSGYTGVSWHKGNQKWQSRIVYQKKYFHLGYYDTPEEASKVYEIAKEARNRNFEEWLKSNINKID